LLERCWCLCPHVTFDLTSMQHSTLATVSIVVLTLFFATNVPSAAGVALRINSVVQQHSRRTCTDTELDTYLYQLTYGPISGLAAPAVAPDCIPTNHRPLALNVATKPEVVSFKAKEKVTNPYFVQLNVVKVYASWCAPPCEDLTWERAASKPATDDPNLQLLEMAIWYDEQRVAMYEFSDSWAHMAQDTYYGMCNGTGWGCPAVRHFRESKKVWERQWTKGIDDSALSKWMGTTLVEALKMVFERNGQHASLAYVGHGSRGDGSLFEGTLNSEDAVTLLSGVGSKFDLFDWGGNCNEGKWNMLSTLQPFADYIIASDLLVVSPQLKDTRMQEYMALAKDYEPLNRLGKLLESHPTPAELGAQLIAGQRHLWEFARAEIQSEKLQQSRALFDMSQFLAVQQELTSKWKSVDDATHSASMTATNRVMCDVSAFGTALCGTTFGATFARLRINRVSTADMFEWDKKTEGLGFNFLGWKEPPCDIAPAVGGKSGTKVCKELPTAFDAGMGGCETYKQGGANHENCQKHWMGDNPAAAVCGQCGTCTPAGAIGSSTR